MKSIQLNIFLEKIKPNENPIEKLETMEMANKEANAVSEQGRKF